MFQQCNVIEYLDLSNFNTSNVTDMSYMFNNCNKLKYLNLQNFILNSQNCITNKMLSFQKNQCKFIANDENLLNLYNL